MNNFFKSLIKDEMAQLIGGIVAFIGLVILIIIGLGFFSALLTVVILGLVIYFGSIKEMAGSIIVVFLAKLLMTEIKSLTGIWISAPKIDQLYSFIESTGYIKLTLLLFLVVFIIRFLTGSIKLFNISVNCQNGTKKEKKKEPEKKIK
ncbi:MAG: hypothetical protein WAW11_00730 [Patescibacteria group bacterium]